MSPELLRVRRQRTQRIWRRSIAYSLDLAAFATSAFLAFSLRFDFALPAQYYRPMWVAMCIWAAAKSASFVIGAVDRGSWQHTSVFDAVRIILAVSAGSYSVWLDPGAFPALCIFLTGYFPGCLRWGEGWQFACSLPGEAGAEPKASRREH